MSRTLWIVASLMALGGVAMAETGLDSQFFPGLAERTDAEVRLAGLARLYPQRVLDAPPETENPRAGQAPLVEELSRGIVYIRIYDLDTSEEAFHEHIDTVALIIDARFLWTPVDQLRATWLWKWFGPDAPRTQWVGEGQPSPQEQSATGPRAEVVSGETPVTREPPVIFLVNGRTRGGIEAWLAALQSDGRVVAIGHPTAGATGRYRPAHSAEGYWVVTGDIRAEDGESLLGEGLMPEVRIRVSAEADARAWERVEQGIDIPAVLNLPWSEPEGSGGSTETASRKPTLPAHDAVLQRAVDIAVARQLLGEVATP